MGAGFKETRAGKGETMKRTWRFVFLTVLGLILVAGGSGSAGQVTPSHRLLVRGLGDDEVISDPEREPPAEDVAKAFALHKKLKSDEALSVGERKKLRAELIALLQRIADQSQQREWAALTPGSGKSPMPVPVKEKMQRLRSSQGRLDDTAQIGEEERRRLEQQTIVVSGELIEEVTSRGWPEYELDSAGNLVRKQEVPSLGPTRGAVTEDGYYEIFRQFHEMNEKRRALTRGTASAGEGPSAESWEQLGKRCAVHCRVTDPRILVTAGPFLLRLRILEAQCYLFASIERYSGGTSGGQLKDYERGIRLLEMLYSVNPDHIGPIPKALDSRNEFYRFNTGVTRWDAGGSKWWLSTREMADYLLSEFCPWGVEVYFVLKRAGLMNQFEWKVLRPYGREGVPDTSSLIVLDEKSVPVHIRKDAAEIAGGTFMSPVGHRIVKWDGEPEITHTICFLSRDAYGMKTSDKIDLGWKAFVLVTAGPLAVLGDIAQDYAMALMGEIFEGSEGIYAEVYNAANLTHEADNWGFDKSWLLEGKVEFKKAKFAKVLLVNLLHMNEQALLDKIFSGMAPGYDELQANAGDPRTYNRSGMPAVIIRTDVHGAVKVEDDEYPRLTDVIRYYQFSPSGLSERRGQYNLWKNPTGNVSLGEEYLRGELGPHLKTWLSLPNTPQPWGFRRYVTDFKPFWQGLRLKFPPEMVGKLSDQLGDDEDLVALLKQADGTLLKGSVQPVRGDEVSWRINDLRTHSRNEAAVPKIRLGGPVPERGPMLGRSEFGRDCFAPSIRSRYELQLLKCERTNEDSSPYRWQTPRETIAKMPVVFYGKSRKPSGTLSRPLPGAVEMSMDYQGPEPKAKAPAYPFTICGVKVVLAGEFRAGEDREVTQRKISFRADGKFQGSSFTGVYRHKWKRGGESREETGKISVSLKPPRRGKDGKIQLSDSVTDFSITYDVKHHHDDLGGGPYDSSIHTEISGSGLKLNPQSTLLTTRTPQGYGGDFLEPGRRGDYLRRLNPWLAVGYFAPESLQSGMRVSYRAEDHNPAADPPLHKVEHLTKLKGCYVEIYFQWHIR